MSIPNTADNFTCQIYKDTRVIYNVCQNPKISAECQACTANPNGRNFEGASKSYCNVCKCSTCTKTTCKAYQCGGICADHIQKKEDPCQIVACTAYEPKLQGGNIIIGQGFYNDGQCGASGYHIQMMQRCSHVDKIGKMPEVQIVYEYTLDILLGRQVHPK